MPVEQLKISVTVDWRRPEGGNGPYKWRDSKGQGFDSGWVTSNVIYRWVRYSDTATAHIGETNRSLNARVNNYASASADSKAGSTNKKIFHECEKLLTEGDYMYLEYASDVAGYDLTDTRKRKLAECLLTGYYRPYLFQ